METLSVPPAAPAFAPFDSSDLKTPTGLLVCSRPLPPPPSYPPANASLTAVGHPKQTSVPAWGSFLYQNFLLPALSPSAEWINNTPFAPSQPQAQASQQVAAPDYFSNSWGTSSSNNGNGASSSSVPMSAGGLSQLQTFALGSAGGSSQSFYNSNALYFDPSTFGQANQQPQQQQQSISPSLLVAPSTSRNISPSLDVVDATIASPSPLASSSPASGVTTGFPTLSSTTMARGLSIDSDAEHDLHDLHDLDHLSPSEHEHDHDEGVERDGMIWGMKVEDYRALSARERKRVRNRISARTFRAKRKEHLSALEQTLHSKDLAIKLATEEAGRLKREVAELKRKLAKYEKMSNSPIA